MPSWLTIALHAFWPLLKAGLAFTVPLTLLAFAGGLLLGFGAALIRLFAHPALSAGVRFYIWLIRGTPLLVQLFIIFYGLPNAGIVLDAFPAALIGFVLNVGAYTSEIIRAAILSVPRGQWQASSAIGMTWLQTMRRTIVPQAARVAIPPLSNSFISLVKDTSLAAALTVPEMFQVAQQIAAVTYEPLILYCETAFIYLIFSSLLSAWQDRIEAITTRHVPQLESAQ